MMLADLVSRLEAATEGSRQLDRDIWWLVDRQSAERCYWNATTGLPRPLVGDMPVGLGRSAVEFSAPKYTRSVDAALTVVPEGMEWHVSNRGKIGVEGRCFAGVYGAPFVGSECDTNAATVPLALCIAALKARAAP